MRRGGIWALCEGTWALICGLAHVEDEKDPRSDRDRLEIGSRSARNRLEISSRSARDQ